jgi:hypothetical protein
MMWTRRVHCWPGSYGASHQTATFVFARLIEEGLKVVGRPVSRSSKKRQMWPAVLGQPLLGIAQGVMDEPDTEKGSAKTLAERKQSILVGQTFRDSSEVSPAETRTSDVT